MESRQDQFKVPGGCGLSDLELFLLTLDEPPVHSPVLSYQRLVATMEGVALCRVLSLSLHHCLHLTHLITEIKPWEQEREEGGGRG